MNEIEEAVKRDMRFYAWSKQPINERTYIVRNLNQARHALYLATLRRDLGWLDAASKRTARFALERARYVRLNGVPR